jgi:Ca2+-binding EF-hand superfamily protein
MMTIDKEKLDKLEKSFDEFSTGIDLVQFIELMRKVIDHRPEDTYNLIHGLRKLFFEIDINGDETMEWSEFTQFIIDTVMDAKGM